MVTCKKYLGLFSMVICSWAYTQATEVEQSSAWLQVKSTTKYMINHPVQTIKTCSRICAKGSGVALAGGVLGYYAIRGIHALAGKLNSVMGTHLAVLAKPVKKVVILASLALLAYECGRSLLHDIKQTKNTQKMSAA